MFVATHESTCCHNPEDHSRNFHPPPLSESHPPRLYVLWKLRSGRFSQKHFYAFPSWDRCHDVPLCSVFPPVSCPSVLVIDLFLCCGDAYYEIQQKNGLPSGASMSFCGCRYSQQRFEVPAALKISFVVAWVAAFCSFAVSVAGVSEERAASIFAYRTIQCVITQTNTTPITLNNTQPNIFSRKLHTFSV
jgi:hypothetical protein